MLTKLRTLALLYRELGLRWSAFRVLYAFRLRTGLVRLQMPMGEWNDYKNRISNKPAGRVAASRRNVSRPRELPENVPWNPQTAIEEADRLLNGELKYFSHQFLKTGFPPRWHQIPSTLPMPSAASDVPTKHAAGGGGLSKMAAKHWSQISDDSDVDIKFIWEPNRFAFVYTLVRAYTATHDEKYPESFWTLTEDWAIHNPPNTGPNWMDGQEIALRLMACTFGYHAFIEAPSSTSERKENFALYVAAQAERIYKNIGYAISTRSNHTISEAFGLWMVGLLFPELKHAKKYFSVGKSLLEQEARNQIFPDGSYSMYSLNYHRFILHIYLYAIRLGELNNSPFSHSLYSSVSSSIEYLAQLIDPQTGQMPLYGSNDGALALPLNNCDFTDYRPLLQSGWYITKGERLFESGEWDEDVFWLCGEIGLTPNPSPERRGERLPSSIGRRVGEEGEISFPHGGLYLLDNTNSHALMRCTDFTSRPSHADQLHVDLWIHGHNIAIDAGTYLYSGEGHWRNGLAHTSVHNTVTVDNKDQMTMLSRFTWTNWSKGKVLKHDEDVWQGEHDGYQPVSHKRTVMALEDDRWLVIDNLAANEMRHYTLHWLLCDGEYGAQKIAPANGLWLRPFGSELPDAKLSIQMGILNHNGDFFILRADANSARGWRSRYYGYKEPAISVRLEADQAQVTFWSFFGFGEDAVEADRNVLRVNSSVIDLNEITA